MQPLYSRVCCVNILAVSGALAADPSLRLYFFAKSSLSALRNTAVFLNSCGDEFC